MPKESRILIIDDEEAICSILKTYLSTLEYKVDSVMQMHDAINCIKDDCHDVILLDIFLKEGIGLDLIPEIKSSSDALVVVMSSYADKETAIKALRLGAFDFLEKPFQLELLSHTINRALEALEANRKIKRLISDLEHRKNELMASQENLESLNNNLVQCNTALTVLAQNIERERDEMEKRVALRLKSLVVPALDKLRHDPTLHRYRFDLHMVLKQIEDLTTGFSADARLAVALSHTELRIASLIKNGLSTEEIAEYLHISPSTVRTHRKNIRKKLKINNSQYTLRTFLVSS
jgi:DNA-binding NarL/FixJ family response regulator